MTAGNLFEQQRANRRRSAIIVTLFIAFFAWIGFGGDLALYLVTKPTPETPAPGLSPGSGQGYQHSFPWFGIGAVLLGLGLTWHARRYGPKEVLWSTGAWQLLEPASLQEKTFVNVVEEMAIASGLPKPTAWIVPDPDPNAFATGISTKDAHVAVTKGLLETLDRDELQAVVAHEMAHIRNDDMKLMTLLAALVGVMALISDGTWRVLRTGGRVAGRSRGGSGGGSGRKGGAGALAAIVLVLWLISVLLAPLVSRLLALGVSRKREFLADASAAQFTRNPAALASALRKIEDVAAPTKAIKRGAAHLCIADPLGRRVTNKSGFLADALATHPPIAVRIARLRQMAYQYEKTGTLPA